MDPLKALMEKTDKVRIVGPGRIFLLHQGAPASSSQANATFRTRDFTAPVQGSINGVLSYKLLRCLRLHV